jgi:hypothetical protein
LREKFHAVFALRVKIAEEALPANPFTECIG